ncbi:O-antigen ligase family protein [Desulfatibacillum aliphaticivorans]|uniref:O-antigen ligase family protein n=1 Tax=Desulfatibacillum aliphaticivorans TaxID=218208 RepID=UPI0003F7BCC0|nr:O-antigen ligase family protein [Desulfatibacillum aliphaticivorans]
MSGLTASSDAPDSAPQLSALGRFCAGAMEALVLVMAMAVPLHFNVLSQHIFENHKYAMFRAGAFVLAGLWMVYMADRGKARKRSLGAPKGLMRPVFLYTLALILSCVFSIGHTLSFWGEIFRHEGLISQLSLIGVFLVIIAFFRSHLQVERVVTVLIFTSLPISLYALAQHYGPDPMPWKGNVGVRCVSTLGNAVFLGAFEVMVFFPTLARIFASLREEEESNAGLWKASIYSMIASLQLLSTFHSKSRGPILGLMAGLIFFAVIWARTLRGPGIKVWAKDVLKLASCLLVGVGVGMFMALMMKFLADKSAVFAATYLIWPIAAVIGCAGLFFSAKESKSSLINLAILCILLALGVGFCSHGIHFVTLEHPQIVQDNEEPEAEESNVWQTVRRQGSMETRVAVWEGYIDIFFSSQPLLEVSSIENREAKKIPFGYLRPVFGFGQETVGTAFRQRYPLRLLKKLPPSETADRAHNDMMSRLAATGVFGLAAYLWLLGAIMVHGLSAAGYSMVKKQRRKFALFFVSGGVLGTTIFLFFGYDLLVLLAKMLGMGGGHIARLESETAYACVGAHVGVLTGVLAYCAFTKGRTSKKPDMANPLAWTAVGLFCALVSHITEIAVSFPFSSTAMLFWTFSGLMVAIAVRRLSMRKPLAPAEEPAPQPKNSKGRQSSQEPKPAAAAPRNMLVLAVLCGVVISLIAYSFLGHQWSIVQQTRSGPVLKMPEFDAVPGMGLLRSVKTNPVEYNEQKSMVFGGLMILPLIVFFVLIFCGSRENPDKLKWGEWPPLLIGAGGLTALSAILVIILHSSSLMKGVIPLTGDPGRVLQEVVNQTHWVASRIWIQYLWMLGIAFILGWLLMQKKDEDAPKVLVPPRAIVTALAVTVITAAAVMYVCVRPVIADVYAARAQQWGSGGASPPLNTKMGSERFLRLIGVAHSLGAVKEASFLTSNHTDLASDAAILAQHTPTTGSFFKDGEPDFDSLKIRELPELNREEVREMGKWALVNCFSINPSDPQNAMNLARLYAQWAHPDKTRKLDPDKAALAADWYNMARSMASTNSYYETEIARFYYQTLRDLDSAREYLERSLELDDRKLPTYLLMADVRMNQLAKTCGPALRSAMTLHQGRDIQPSPECQKGLDEVAALMEKALTVRPDSAEGLIKLAGVFINARKPQKAVEALEKGFVVEPMNADFMKQLVFICKKENDISLGQNLFDKIEKEHPDKKAVILASAAFYLQTNQREKVVPTIERALDSEDPRPDMWREAAKLYGIMGDFEKAAECIEEALKKQGRKAMNWMVAAGVYEQLKDYKKAAYSLERSAHLTRNKQYAISLFMRSAEMWKQAGVPARARDIERLVENIKKRPDDS